MTKRAITIWWIIGSVVMFAGMFGAMAVSFSSDTGNFLNNHAVGSLALTLFVMFAGVTLQLVAWIGALINTHLVVEKTWFKALLWIGIAGIITSPAVIGGILFWALMLTYVIGGPDGKAVQAPTATPTKLAPTT